MLWEVLWMDAGSLHISLRGLAVSPTQCVSHFLPCILSLVPLKLRVFGHSLVVLLILLINVCENVDKLKLN
jgi:hypothetical protein